MYRTILVPLDGSPLSERALPTACALARATRARLVLVRVAWAAGLPGVDPTEVQVQAVDIAEGYLTGMASQLAGQGLVADIAVPYDRPADGILTEVALRRADLVVMTTHGRSGLGRWVYGSVAEAVLSRSPVPVLLVRGAAQEPPLVSKTVRPRLLVPLDGSPFAETALPHATSLARALDATVILVRALSAPTVPTPELAFVAPVDDSTLAEEEALEAERYLGARANRLRQQNVRVQVVVRPGPAADAILEESRLAGVSLVVMATHGRTGLGRLMFGSVALEVVHRGELALLLVRPAGLIDARQLSAVGEQLTDDG